MASNTLDAVFFPDFVAHPIIRFLSKVFTDPSSLYWHSRAVSSSREARIRWHIAWVASRGVCCVGRTTRSPLRRLVLVQGRWMADAFPNFLFVIQSLREGNRLASISSMDVGISSPRRICPIQAHIAIASAHFSPALPVCQAVASDRILLGVTSGRCDFCCFSLGQCNFIAHSIVCIWRGTSNGRPWRFCQSAMVAMFAVAVPVPVRLMPFAMNKHSSLASHGLCLRGFHT